MFKFCFWNEKKFFKLLTYYKPTRLSHIPKNKNLRPRQEILFFIIQVVVFFDMQFDLFVFQGLPQLIHASSAY